MSHFKITISLINNISLMFLITFILSRTTSFKNIILNRENTFMNKIFLAIIFSLFGIFGTYYGFPIEGAIANSRVVGVMVAGLLGGPFVGISAGMIAGIHRWAIDIGGFTSLACMLSTIVESIIASIGYHYRDRFKRKWILGFWITVLGEILQMFIIIMVAKPYRAAVNLVYIIAVPMTLMNALGVALFLMLIENIYREQEREGAIQSELALKITEKTLPYLRHGINRKTALATCNIIHSMAKVDAVAMTKGTEILAHIGVGSDHHLPGEIVKTSATQMVLKTKKSMILSNREEIGCSHKDCKLNSAVIVPLLKKSKVIGVLKIYKTQKNAIRSTDLKLAEGLANLFSTQIELAEIDYKARLLEKAELKALQAQINPHFLFNALNTIVSMTRIDTEIARKLLINLSNYLRENFRDKEDMVDIDSELKHIKAYLEIEKARFGERLNVIYQIKSSHFKIPHLILQPLVENAVKHGIYPKKGKGTIYIIVEEKKSHYRISIEDNGVGFDLNSKENRDGGIAIKNINKRLKSIYGEEYGLKIDSKKNIGTNILIYIPKGGDSN